MGSNLHRARQRPIKRPRGLSKGITLGNQMTSIVIESPQEIYTTLIISDILTRIMSIRLLISYLALLLIVSTLAQEAAIRPDTADSKRVGAYTQIPLDQLKTLQSQDQTISFAELQDFVRKQVSNTGYFEGKEIGKVVKLQVQVVSGRNFRYTFKNSQGQKFTATVFDQPWTNTRRLAHINLAVPDDL